MRRVHHPGRLIFKTFSQRGNLENHIISGVLFLFETKIQGFVRLLALRKQAALAA
jgi:hypothetical protein